MKRERTCGHCRYCAFLVVLCISHGGKRAQKARFLQTGPLIACCKCDAHVGPLPLKVERAIAGARATASRRLRTAAGFSDTRSPPRSVRGAGLAQRPCVSAGWRRRRRPPMNAPSCSSAVMSRRDAVNSTEKFFGSDASLKSFDSPVSVVPGAARRGCRCRRNRARGHGRGPGGLR